MYMRGKVLAQQKQNSLVFGKAMTAEGNEWYGASIANESTASIVFNGNGTDAQKTIDLSITAKGEYWYYTDSKWYTYNPEGLAVSASPETTSFSTATLEVTLKVGGESVTTGKYTLDGSDPANGTTYTNGTKIVIGSDMNINDVKTLKLYANGSKVVTNSYTYTKIKNENPTGTMKLGALYTSSQTIFRIWSPDSSNVVVNVNAQDYNCTKIADFEGYTNIYEARVAGDLKLKEYQFKINGKAVRDPYGLMIKAGTNVNIVMDMTSISPDGGWVARPTLTNREDAIIYEVHVRDFTIDSNSGVSTAKKGKFMGMVETGTTYGSVKTGIDHLKELGITHVQILPMYDFGTGMYNWGYDPVNYNIPEDQYSMTPSDYENRVKEVKNMINEYHKNGIRVVMDVVYNHTLANEMFQDITTKYYDGQNLSGCGNSVDSGNPMVSRFIQDSLNFWVKEYQIDGFRFDLIGIFHYTEVNKWGESVNANNPDANILMYGEPWNGYATDKYESQKVRMGKVPAMTSGHIGVFNGKYREDIKGDNDGVKKAYMFNDTISWSGAIAVGMRGSLTAAKSTSILANDWDSMFAYDPEQSINYISAHDNYCLWDKIIHAGATGGGTGYAGRVNRFGMGMVLTSQGIPFIHAGDEMLRTKATDGVWTYAHNSYNAPDTYNMIRWNWKSDNAGMFNYYKDLITLRKNHPGLRLTSWDEIKNRMKTEMKGAATGINVDNNSTLPDRVVVSYLDEDNNVGNGYELAVVYNPGSNFDISLPSGTWNKIFDANGLVNKTDKTCEGTAITVFTKQ